MEKEDHDKFTQFILNLILLGLLVLFFGIISFILYLIFSFMDQQNQFINGIFSFLGGVLGGLLTLIGVRLTLIEQRKLKKEESLELQKLKEQENIEANRKVRDTYQLMVLNMLAQMRNAFRAEWYGNQDPNIIGYLPQQFIVPLEILIKHIDDPMFPTHSDLIFRKVRMIQSLYYDDSGKILNNIHKGKYKQHVRNVLDNIIELHDRLEEGFRYDKL